MEAAGADGFEDAGEEAEVPRRRLYAAAMAVPTRCEKLYAAASHALEAAFMLRGQNALLRCNPFAQAAVGVAPNLSAPYRPQGTRHRSWHCPLRLPSPPPCSLGQQSWQVLAS